MTIYGYDSAQPPTQAEADAAAKSGIKVWAGYIGGPNAASSPWPASAWAAVKRAGITPLPIYCGSPGESVQGQVDAAIAAAKKAGLGKEIVLDIEQPYGSEYGGEKVDAFVNAWNAALKAAGYTSVVYAGTHYSGGAANWDPDWNGSAAAATGGAHQYAGSVERDGVDVDLDAFSSSFPLDGAQTGGPGDGDTKVVVSPAEMARLLDAMDSAHEEMVIMYTHLTNVLQEFPSDPSTAGGAAAQYEQALAILNELNGTSTAGLRHARGEIYQMQLLAQRVKARAEKADS